MASYSATHPGAPPAPGTRAPAAAPGGGPARGELAIWLSAPLVVVVPLVHGGMGTAGGWLALLLGAAFVVGAAWLAPRDASIAALRTVGGAAAVLLVAMALQVVPMPAAWVRVVAPRMEELAALAPSSQASPRVSLAELGLGEDLGSLSVPRDHADSWKGLDPEPPRAFRPAALSAPMAVRSWARLFAWLALLWAFAASSGAHRARLLLLRLLGASALVVAPTVIATRLTEAAHFIYRPALLERAQPAGTFVNRNHLAAYVYLTLPPLVLVLMRLLKRRPRSRAAKFDTAAMAILGCSALGLVLAAGLFTGSRAGAVLLLLEVAALGAANVLAMKRPGSAAMVGGVGLAAVLGALAMDHGGFLRRFEDMERRNYAWAESYDARLSMFRASFTVMKEFPVLGAGLGNAGLALDVLGLQPWNVFYDHVHSEYLQWMAQTGAVGTVAGLVALALLLRGLRVRAFGGPRAWTVALPLVALAIHSAVDFPLRTTSVAVAAAALFGWLLGQSAGTGAGDADDDRARDGRTRRRQRRRAST